MLLDNLHQCIANSIMIYWRVFEIFYAVDFKFGCKDWSVLYILLTSLKKDTGEISCYDVIFHNNTDEIMDFLKP